MADLIDRAALLEFAELDAWLILPDEHEAKDILAMIATAPAVDAVEVVRCKDCDNWDLEHKAGRESLGNLVCPCSEWSNYEDGHSRFTRPNDFCSYGERRTNATD